MPTRIEISFKTILFIFATVIGLAFIWKIKYIILLLFIALILVSALRTPVEWLVSKNIPRGLAIALIYIVGIGLFSGIFILVVPPLVEQSTHLLNRLPFLVEQLNSLIVFYQIPTSELAANLTRELTSLGTKFTFGLFGAALAIITLLVLTFYMLLEWRKVTKLAVSLFTGQQEEKALKIINDVEHGLGNWVRGQLTLSIIVAVLVFIGLKLLGVHSALPLAIIAGLLEVVPIIGPIIAAIPGILVAFSIAPLLAIATAALYFIIQQLENHIIVPVVMSKAVGVNPLVTIIVLMIGAQIAGILGVLIAVPVAIAVKVLVNDLLAPKIKLTGEELEELEEIEKE